MQKHMTQMQMNSLRVAKSVKQDIQINNVLTKHKKKKEKKLEKW